MSTPSPVVARSLRPPWPLILVWLAVLGVFLPALRGAYVDDDLDLLAASPVFAGIDHLWDAVRAPFWGNDLGYWRPLTSLGMGVGHWLGAGEPWPTHAFALLAHLAATTLAFAILRRLGVDARMAALAAAVFALHPCQVESVAWVAALGDPLVGAATLLAVYAWLGWRQNQCQGWPGGAWLGVALAVGSKESGVAAVAWLLGLELALRARRGDPERAAPGRSTGLRVVCGWGGVAAVVGLWLGLRVLVFGDWRAGFDRGALDIGAHGAHALLVRAYLALGFTALPTGWLGFTPYRWIPPEVPGLVRGALPLLLLVVPFAAASWAAHRARPVVARLGVLGAAASLLPAILMPRGLGPWPLVDRYLYTALFGVVAVLLATGRCRTWLAVVLAFTCAGGSCMLVPLWRSHEAVVTRALADCQRHPEPHYMLGNLERERGDRTPPAQAEVRRAHFAAAVAAFARARTLLLRPIYAGPHLRAVVGLNARLGEALAASAGRVRAASTIATDLVTLSHEYPDSVPVLLVLGAVHADAGDFIAAEAAWRQALDLDASAHQAAFNLGRLYLQQGKLAPARAMLEHALAVQPSNAEARRLLAVARQ